MSNTWSKRDENRKMTFRIVENETEIDFVLIKKEHQQFTQNVKAIPGELQHALVIAGMDKKKIREVVRKTNAERRKITLLKDVKIRKQFDEKVIKLVYIGAPNLWGHFKDGVLKACDEVCWRKERKRSKVDTWWWNEEVKEAVSRKKARKVMSQNSTEENKRKHKSLKNKAKKAVSKAMREKAEEAFTELQNCPFGMSMYTLNRNANKSVQHVHQET